MLKSRLAPPSSWFISIVYASIDFQTRIDLWDQLSYFYDNLISREGMSWLVGGDFNEILIVGEKFGGSRINPYRSNLFWNYINHCNLIELGFRDS